MVQLETEIKNILDFRKNSPPPFLLTSENKRDEATITDVIEQQLATRAAIADMLATRAIFGKPIRVYIRNKIRH
jgi:hypothetical protein